MCAVGRGVIAQHHHALRLDGVEEGGEVLRYVFVHAVLAEHFIVVKRGKLLAQMAHLRRIVVDGIKYLVDGHRLVFGEMNERGDLLEEGRLGVNVVARPFFHHDKPHLLERIDIAIDGAAAHRELAAHIVHGEVAVLGQHKQQPKLPVKFVKFHCVWLEKKNKNQSFTDAKL